MPGTINISCASETTAALISALRNIGLLFSPPSLLISKRFIAVGFQQRPLIFRFTPLHILREAVDRRIDEFAVAL